MHGWIFWLIPVVVFAMITRRRRWERWAAMGPQGEMMSSGWRYRGRSPQETGLDQSARRELEQQQGYIEALETRVSELEDRLDFTERLLAKRHETGAEEA